MILHLELGNDFSLWFLWKKITNFYLDNLNFGVQMIYYECIPFLMKSSSKKGVSLVKIRIIQCMKFKFYFNFDASSNLF